MMRSLGNKVCKVLKLSPSDLNTPVKEDDQTTMSLQISQQYNDISLIHEFSELLLYLDSKFQFDQAGDSEEDSSLECIPCKKLFGNEFSGKITVHALVLSEYTQENKKRKKEKFHIIRNSLKRHLKSKSHLIAVQTEEERKKEEEKLMVRNEKAGMLCARIIHNNIFESRSYASYERDVSLQSKISDVGVQNHSRMFAAAFVKSMAEMVDSKLASLVTNPLACIGNRLRPVAITGDKGTMKGLTLQPMGILIPILQNGYFTTELFVGTPLLKSWTGKGIADNLIQSLEKQTISQDILSTNISGACLDGEYFLKHVPEHIADVLGFDDQMKENFIRRCIWDPAHRLELSDEHAREKSKSIQTFYAKVHAHILHFKIGKQRIALANEADHLNTKLYETRHSSDTRFVAHEHKVLANQFMNWDIQYQFWEKRSQELLNDIEDGKLTSVQITDSQKKSSELRNVAFITTFQCYA